MERRNLEVETGQHFWARLKHCVWRRAKIASANSSAAFVDAERLSTILAAQGFSATRWNRSGAGSPPLANC